MRCSQCGYELSPEAKFCPVCGCKINNIQPAAVNVPNRNIQEAPKKSKKNIIIIILVLLLVIAGVTAAYLILSSSDNTQDEPAVTESIIDTESEKADIVVDEPDTADEKEGIVKSITDKNVQESAAKQIPVETASPNSSPSVSSSKNGGKKSYYTQKAENIEVYAEQLTNSASSQIALNNAVYDVYSEWDKLLNEVYQYLKSTLPSSEFEALKKDEAVWIKEKEAAMEEERQLWSGGSAENMAVYGVASQYTQERCYYLISLID